jgi:hypothetical protein
MGVSERRVGVSVLVLAAALAVGLLSSATWIGWKVYSDSHSVCGRWPVSSSSVPVPDGFEVERSVSIAPEGCGADFKRRATVAPTSDADVRTLERYRSALVAQGWTEVDCAVPDQRCLDDGRHFVAITQTDRVLVVTVQPSSRA